MRTVIKKHKAAFSPVADLITYSPLPSHTLRQVDPFIFLNHHGPQVYPPNNRGLPFGPHPHRGMETVTFIVEGDIMHKDSGGHESVIEAGGVQYMTAGRGLIHAEVSSERFKREGGRLEILQLWLNLPARLKMTEPQYIGLQKDEIPKLTLDGGKVKVQLVSGHFEGHTGGFQSLTGVQLRTVRFAQGGKAAFDIPDSENIFFYVVQGRLLVNGTVVSKLELVEFGTAGGGIQAEAIEDSLLLLGHAQPYNEPLVAQGPFVMNTEAEIRQAYADYQAGKFGVWQE